VFATNQPVIENRRLQLSDEAARYVRELIMSGQLRPGEHVRPEQIANALGISATPVREGLLALRAEGFLQLLPRRGFVVAPLSADDIRDLFVTQALIAGELAARAAERLTDKEIAELKELQVRIDEAARTGAAEEMERLNHQFHRRINLAAQSEKLLWILRMITKYGPRRFYADIVGWPNASAHDHSAVMEALAARDPEAARRAIADHVRHAGDLLAKHFEATGMM
jgi:DNA-binding GntR family transcriptional regulator